MNGILTFFIGQGCLKVAKELMFPDKSAQSYIPLTYKNSLWDMWDYKGIIKGSNPSHQG